MKRILFFSLCLAVAPLGGCARDGGGQNSAALTGDAEGKGVAIAEGDDWDTGAEVKVHDPIEPVNRGVFWFNHQLYTFVAKPFSTVYKFILPEVVRKGVRNAYDNIRFPVRFVNHTLQGRLDRTAKETGRFLVNSTVGVGGLMKPADKMPALADVPKADTGQTFAKWGVPHGPYLVFPALGPTSCRDLVGTAGDVALNPLSWVSLAFPGAAWTVGATAPSGAHSVPDQMDRYDAATKDSLDPYIAARTSYIQYREAQRTR
ncbi:MAG: MlaA family lipoprotein [Chthoniobacterales bacterium]